MKRLLFLTVLVLVAATGYAQTPDGETPANEGVCDELIGFTPGLYGLCVAYCESMDCQLGVTAEPPCSNANSKVLRNYLRKMAPGDPYMPCLSEGCPCFTLDEVLAFESSETTDAQTTCLAEPDTESWGRADGWIHTQGVEIAIVRIYPLETSYCFYDKTAIGDQRFVAFDQPASESDLADAWACYDLIYEACLIRGDCAFLSPQTCPSYPTP